MKIKLALGLFFSIVIVAGLSLPASAHKVIVFAWVENGKIYVEGGFGGQRKAQNSTVVVTDENGTEVIRGTTDEKGAFTFDVPKNVQSDLIIVLEAGTGHKGQWRLKQDEFASGTEQNDHETAMAEKEKLEKSPSIFKIAGGIGVIFLAALLLRLFKRKS